LASREAKFKAGLTGTGKSFQESQKIMLPRLAALLYSALRFSKYRNGDFYSAFKANADNQSIGPQGPQ
jgi:hypothetical protein